MAFTSPNTGDRIEASHITQIIDAWTGSSGAGEPLTNVQVTDASNYAGDFQNLHADSLGLRVRDTSSNELFKAVLAGCTLSKTTTLSRGTITTDLKVLDASATWNAAVTFTALKLNVTDSSSNAASLLMDLQVGGSSKAWVKKNGDIYSANMIFVGDNANAQMGHGGITLNYVSDVNAQTDTEMIAFKDGTNVAHGMTGVTETDTFGYIKINNTSDGGLNITGITDDGGSSNIGLFLKGINGAAANTTKTTGGAGVITLNAAVKNSTNITAVGADGNLVTIVNQSNTRFIFDAEGSAHGDVEWTTYDSHDDLALLNKLDAAMTRDPIKTEFGKYLSDYRQELQNARVVNFYDDGPRAMVNFTRLAMLHTGALRQLGQRLAIAEQRLAALPGGTQ